MALSRIGKKKPWAVNAHGPEILVVGNDTGQPVGMRRQSAKRHQFPPNRPFVFIPNIIAHLELRPIRALCSIFVKFFQKGPK